MDLQLSQAVSPKRPIKLRDDWRGLLEQECEQTYMQDLRAFLLEQKLAGKIIFPPGPEIFAALDATSFADVKVVILGQDPYHGDSQAHGLCFSVRKGVAIPPSLQNIYKEIASDLGISIPAHGDLSYWAKQGVLLLNSVLTVERGLAASHQGRGWERFTDKIISLLNEREQPLVFMLWGSYAQKKGLYINTNKHLVLQTVHPSPLSAYRGFLGCKHFSKANSFLERHGIKTIDWSNL